MCASISKSINSACLLSSVDRSPFEAKMKTAFVLLAGLAMAAAQAPTCATGLAGWTCNAAYKKCYKTGPNLVNWGTARSYCSTQSQSGFPTGSTGKLNEPSFSNGESSYIQQFVPRGQSNADTQVIWLGIQRSGSNTNSNWFYTSTPGSLFAQSMINPWGKAQPDWPSSQQDTLCLALYKSWTSIGFDDGSQSGLKYPLCETPCT